MRGICAKTAAYRVESEFESSQRLFPSRGNRADIRVLRVRKCPKINFGNLDVSLGPFSDWYSSAGRFANQRPIIPASD